MHLHQKHKHYSSLPLADRRNRVSKLDIPSCQINLPLDAPEDHFSQKQITFLTESNGNQTTGSVVTGA